MPNSTEPFSQRFAALTLREQRLVVGTGLLLLWGCWDSFLYQPQQQERQRLANDIKQIEQLLNSQQALAVELETAGRQDPNLQNRQNLAALQQSIGNLKQQLDSGDKRFVPSQRMAAALQDMLKQHGGLQLIGLETQPPKTFGGEEQPAWVFRHTLNLTLQGDYFSTLNYLKALETLPWRIHWDSIDYQVKNYPLAETRIQVYTLSFEQDWLGV
ncbi:MAG: type II secretion system protein M [Methylomonas sp.]|nr:type II secretion system protein M [Methylomonas sp.]